MKKDEKEEERENESSVQQDKKALLKKADALAKKMQREANEIGNEDD